MWIHFVGRLANDGDDFIRTDCCRKLKNCLNAIVFRQALFCQLATTNVYAAVGTIPMRHSLDICKMSGIGVLAVDGERVSCVLEPECSLRSPYIHRVKDALERAKHYAPGGVGGRLNLLGESTTYRTYKVTQEWILGHPRASWKEIFFVVPNRYKDWRSFYSAMRIVRLNLAHWEGSK